MASALRTLAGIAGQGRDDALAPYGLDGGRLDLLEALAASGPSQRLTAGELARQCRVTPGAISQRLAGLEKASLVERHREAPDKRTVHVELTRQGRDLVASVGGVVAEAEGAMLDGLTSEQRASLAAVLTAWRDLVAGRESSEGTHDGRDGEAAS